MPFRSGHRALVEELIEPAAPHRRALRARHRSPTPTPTTTLTRALRLHTLEPLTCQTHAASHVRSRYSLLVLLSSPRARGVGAIRSLTSFVSSAHPTRARGRLVQCPFQCPDPILSVFLYCTRMFILRLVVAASRQSRFGGHWTDTLLVQCVFESTPLSNRS